MLVESAYAWRRLAASPALGTIGGVGLWSVVVVLPAVQAEFGVARGSASLPYTATMLGFAVGGLSMGRLADRIGIVTPLVVGSIALGLGYVLADISHRFTRHRGIAVSVCASGNYLAGAVWPPILQHVTATQGWRPTLLNLAIALWLLGAPRRGAARA
jgi:MFS family permease